MSFCRSISFCFYIGFAGMIAHAVIGSVVLLLSFAIEAVTEPFMNKIVMHEMFTALCVFLVLSWIISPLALCCFRKAMNIANGTDASCAVVKK